MTTVARRIRAAPERSAIEVWRVIETLISQDGSGARRELDTASGVAASLIGDEAPKDSPIVVAGSGPRLRIYCIYGDDAVTGEGSNESDLATDPTNGDWRMWLPAGDEDIEWVSEALTRRSNRITAYNPKVDEPGTDKASVSEPAEFTVIPEAFKRP